MALANFADLKATVIAFSGKDNLTANMNDFVLLAEEAMYFNDRNPLRLRSMETTSTLSTVAGTKTLALPAGFLESRSLSIEAGGGEHTLHYVAPSALPTPNASGRPRAYTVTDKIEFDYTPDAAYTINISYFAKPTALSTGNQTNTVLTNHPSIYLNACLSSVNEFGGEPEMAQYFHDKMLRSIRGAMKGDGKGSVPSNAQMRVHGSRP